MAYFDFFCVPMPEGNKEAYLEQAKLFRTVMKEHGLIDYVEAMADDVPRGEVTDFYRAVQAKDGETVIASYAAWPDKETRDKGWAAMMEDPRMKEMSAGDMPFDGKRMFWGGFTPLITFD